MVPVSRRSMFGQGAAANAIQTSLSKGEHPEFCNNWSADVRLDDLGGYVSTTWSKYTIFRYHCDSPHLAVAVVWLTDECAVELLRRVRR